MISSAYWPALLAVFSGLSMNLLLQFGLGLRGIALEKAVESREIAAGSGIIFVTVILLWLFFLFIRSVLVLGFLEYLLVFPVSVLVFSLFEYLLNHFILKEPVTFGEIYSPIVSGAALFITLNVAGNVLEAAVLCAGFCIGIVLAALIVAEIRRRSEIEAVPRWLRGGPLALISMGLLSLVCSSCAVMLFEILGVR